MPALPAFRPEVLCDESFIVTKRTGWGDTRLSYSVYFLMARDGLTHKEATARSEAVAYYTDDRSELEAMQERFIRQANDTPFGTAI